MRSQQPRGRLIVWICARFFPWGLIWFWRLPLALRLSEGLRCIIGAEISFWHNSKRLQASSVKEPLDWHAYICIVVGSPRLEHFGATANSSGVYVDQLNLKLYGSAARNWNAETLFQLYKKKAILMEPFLR
jgi:hypothetical protein